jgi:hypothetical protein
MLHQIAKEYGQTPAMQVGVSDPLLAFCLNRACYWAGTHWTTPKAIM